MTTPNTNELRETRESMEIILRTAGFAVHNGVILGEEIKKPQVIDKLAALFTRHHNALISKLIGESRVKLKQYNWSSDKDYQLSVIAFRELLAEPDITLLLEKEVK